MAPGASYTASSALLTYHGPRRREDTLTVQVRSGADANGENDVSLVGVIFSYCDLKLERPGSSGLAPNDGGREASSSPSATWAALHAVVLAPIKVSVNLSVRQLDENSLPDTVAAILEETGVQPSDLWLEITETALMEDPASTFEALANLQRLGVGLAIDDFGVGFSSLNRLRQLPPVEVIKIDKVFVDGLAAHPADPAIVAAAISLADALGGTTVAEGVETADQAAALHELGCELAQGYHFSRPKPPEDFDGFMGPGSLRSMSAA